MRYLTKLSDQTLALVSASQTRSFIWESSARDHVIPEHQRSADAESRLEEFEVRELDEQEEAAISSPGFKLMAHSLFPMSGDRVPSEAHLVSGEEKIGLLTRKMKEAHVETSPYDEDISQMTLRDIIRSREGHPQLVLGELSLDSLDILSSNGLRDKYPEVFQEFYRNQEDLNKILRQEQEAAQRDVDEVISRDKPILVQEIRGMIYQKYVDLYPILTPSKPEIEYGKEMGALLRAQYYESGLDKVEHDIQQHKINHIQNTEFCTLKLNWLYLRARVDENKHLSEADLEGLVNRTMNEASENSEAESSSKRAGLVARATHYVLGKVGFSTASMGK
ncbi:unnamed protein product [Rhizoctonia solani]|uniref:Uncharacterized protein n=1 Tax=Rhizoctonia solani TaxID=456999 RepID=A0A8H3BEI2_9AGAM|nr:unnamed protein product [Rhizoctonia solani]